MLIFRSVLWLLFTANVPGSLILVTLMMVAMNSSETSVLTRATGHSISADGILHSHRRENRLGSVSETLRDSCELRTGFIHSHRRKNLKSYIASTG
jgi:hypothetical protein